MKIVPAPASITSGYLGAVLNIGKLRNKGWEFLVNAVPVKGKKFSWTTSLNGSYNASKVLQLAAGQSSFLIATSRTALASTVDIVGKPLDEIQAYDYKYADGKIVVDPVTGIPEKGDLKTYGPALAPWGVGFNNQFTFGHFDLSFLIDGKFGGKVFAGSEYYAFQDGLTKSTLPGRETGFYRNRWCNQC